MKKSLTILIFLYKQRFILGAALICAAWSLVSLRIYASSFANEYTSIIALLCSSTAILILFIPGEKLQKIFENRFYQPIEIIRYTKACIKIVDDSNTIRLFWNGWNFTNYQMIERSIIIEKDCVFFKDDIEVNFKRACVYWDAHKKEYGLYSPLGPQINPLG